MKIESQETNGAIALYDNVMLVSMLAVGLTVFGLYVSMSVGWMSFGWTIGGLALLWRNATYSRMKKLVNSTFGMLSRASYDVTGLAHILTEKATINDEQLEEKDRVLVNEYKDILKTFRDNRIETPYKLLSRKE